ncbi:MAG: hypothetical protein LBC48_08060 [Dysgonamonadaceae bacterium]|jgi:predicted nucleic acid-binding protein|nr:hypothetical protein [Dysgonamonadaceae bacterium]
MLKVFSNTMPLISLLKIGKLEILRDLYGEILVPQAVFDEIEAGKTKVLAYEVEKTANNLQEALKNPETPESKAVLDKYKNNPVKFF